MPFCDIIHGKFWFSTDNPQKVNLRTRLSPRIRKKNIKLFLDIHQGPIRCWLVKKDETRKSHDKVSLTSQKTIVSAFLLTMGTVLPCWQMQPVCLNVPRVFSLVRGKLRPYFIEQLPASVRTTLLEDTAAFLLHKSSVSGMLAAVLLFPKKICAASLMGCKFLCFGHQSLKYPVQCWLVTGLWIELKKHIYRPFSSLEYGMSEKYVCI
jgi:hypothetical protein